MNLPYGTSRMPLLLGLLVLLLTTGCSSPVDQAKPAKTTDMVLMGGNIYTLNWKEPDRNGRTASEAPYTKAGWQGDAQALAILDGIIIDVGSDQYIESYIGEATRVIEVNGATVLPGFVDSHTHVPELGALLSRVNLIGIETEEQAISLIEDKAKDTPEGEWIVGQGWDEGVWANHYPDMKLLSERVPGHPVLMRSLHGFGAWGNKLAFERAGITRETVSPVGGEILHFDNGEPNGLLLNNATKFLNDAIPAADKKALKRQTIAGLNQMAKDGFVTVHDAGPGSDVMTALQELEDSGDLLIRFYAMISARDEAFARKWIVNGPDEDNNSRLVIRAVKGYYDGALGSRGARMLEDYSDKPGHKGVSGVGYGFDNSLVEELMVSGFQIGIHAIGDAGNRETLDFFKDVFTRHPGTRNNRHRIEHAQVLHPDDLGRFAEMGIIASMEPPHAVEDKTWAEERIGDERIKGAYAWRSLRQSGVTVIFWQLLASDRLRNQFVKRRARTSICLQRTCRCTRIRHASTSIVKPTQCCTVNSRWTCGNRMT